MIKRRKYSKELKKRLALEIISKVSSYSQVAKRECISSKTLKVWVSEFVKGNSSKGDSELIRLKQENEALRMALSDSILENQILKKTEIALQEMMHEDQLSNQTLVESLES